MAWWVVEDENRRQLGIEYATLVCLLDEEVDFATDCGAVHERTTLYDECSDQCRNSVIPRLDADSSSCNRKLP